VTIEATPTGRSMVFGHLPISYDERVLEPRPWTVAQSRWAAEWMGHEPARVLELCAGAGHIGLLALTLAGAPDVAHRLVTVDVNPVACDLTARNATAAGLDHLLEVRNGLIEDVLTQDDRFDVVIADPPWVNRSDTGRFPDDPLVAIDGGDDGLDIAWHCLRAADAHLVPGGSVVLQLGSPEQVSRVADHLPDVASGLSLVEVRPFGPQGVLVLLTREPAAHV